MSYALRNTLILLVVLILIVGGGWSYFYFVQWPEIENLETELTQKTQELREKQQIADRYETVLAQFENARYYYKNYEKALYSDNNEDRVFDFINTLNTGSAYTDFSFSFQDSTASNQYGIMTMGIEGESYYRYLVNLIRKIEYSKPLNKISNITITPINNLEDYGRVTFSFTLESYYERKKLLDEPSMDVVSATFASLYNPFYPLIRDIEPNTDELVDIEKSKLLALSSDRIFMVDQTGVMQKIKPGDRVYLGHLKGINSKDGSATFELNKGGIIEVITLEVNSDNSQDHD